MGVELREVRTWDELNAAGPGAWMRTHREGGADSIILNCVDCGRSASMSSHTITFEPLTVSPSIVCPFTNEQPPCSAHYFIRDGKVV
jgi:hypothetical protein